MTTKNLLAAVAKRAGMSEAEAAEMLDATTQAVAQNLEKGNSVHVVNFGIFEMKEKKARTIVHPKTGERSTIPAKKQISFKQSPALKGSINK